MAEGGSFFSQQVGEPQRRAFLELDRRLGEVQATIDALSPAHGDLTGLGDDDHPQYLTEARGDARYYTQAVADARYYTQSQVDSSLTGKSDTSHTHSYAATNHNHTYNVNNAWLRDNGDNAHVKMYGNSRQMVFRTDGTTEYASGVSTFAFLWMYGGDAAGDRRMGLNSSGQLWCSNYGYLHDKFADIGHTHSYASTSHTHSYLPTSGGTISGALTVTGVVRGNEFVGDNGSASDPSFCFSSDTDCGMYRYTTNQIGFSTANTFRMRIHSDGIHLASGDWFRSYGSTGWYNGSHGGGMYMIDSTWVRTYNNKRIYTGSGQIRSDAGNAFNAPNMTSTWSFNTVRWNTNGDLMRYASLTEMKTDIVEINGVLGYLNERSFLYDLTPRIFHEAEDRVDHEGNPVYTTRGEYGHGFLAEEVLEVAPELAFFDQDGNLTSYGNDALIPDIVAELQRLMPMVEELYGAAHPDWVPPSPRPADRAADERQRYEEAAAAQAAVGFDDISDPLDGQRHLDEEE